ncbi:uncharacterized protein [Cherax quadricarinatus]|uniref:uncharacterized protein isoform X2 n=1 Tax=Cherax quadricarinatus TaxID=27406 RepID=UPI00387E394E
MLQHQMLFHVLLMVAACEIHLLQATSKHINEWVPMPNNSACIPVDTYAPWPYVRQSLNELFRMNIMPSYGAPPLPVRMCLHNLAPCNANDYCGMKNETEREVNMCVITNTTHPKVNQKQLVLKYLEHSSCECLNFENYNNKVVKDFYTTPTITNAEIHDGCEMPEENHSSSVQQVYLSTMLFTFFLGVLCT